MSRIAQWFRQACTVEPLTVDVWYFDALGCRIDAGTFTMPHDGDLLTELKEYIRIHFDKRGSAKHIFCKVRSDQ